MDKPTMTAKDAQFSMQMFNHLQACINLSTELQHCNRALTAAEQQFIAETAKTTMLLVQTAIMPSG